jgi:hypothetical protein
MTPNLPERFQSKVLRFRYPVAGRVAVPEINLAVPCHKVILSGPERVIDNAWGEDFGFGVTSTRVREPSGPRELLVQGELIAVGECDLVDGEFAGFPCVFRRPGASSDVHSIYVTAHDRLHIIQWLQIWDQPAQDAILATFAFLPPTSTDDQQSKKKRK